MRHACIFLLGLFASTACSSPRDDASTTTVFLVRHAEKRGGGGDVDLAEAGVARAHALAHALAHVDLAAVYVSDRKRTQRTGAPVAASHGVPTHEFPASAVSAAAEDLLSRYGGQTVLVVGHSNTLDDFLAVLGGRCMEDLDEREYDRLIVAVLRGRERLVMQPLQFGSPTP